MVGGPIGGLRDGGGGLRSAYAVLPYRLTGYTLELYGKAVRAPKAHRPPIEWRRSLRFTRAAGLRFSSS